MVALLLDVVPNAQNRTLKKWNFDSNPRYGPDEVDKINISQLKSPFRGHGQFRSNLAKNCDTLYLMICSNVRIFFETLSND